MNFTYNVFHSGFISFGSRTTSPLRNKDKVQLLPTRTTIPRTTPHQDHYKLVNPLIRTDITYLVGNIVLVESCPDTMSFITLCLLINILSDFPDISPCLRLTSFISTWFHDMHFCIQTRLSFENSLYIVCPSAIKAILDLFDVQEYNTC